MGKYPFHKKEVRQWASRHYSTTARGQHLRHFGSNVTDPKAEDDITFICGYCGDPWPCEVAREYEAYQLEAELLQKMWYDTPAKEVDYPKDSPPEGDSG